MSHRRAGLIVNKLRDILLQVRSEIEEINAALKKVLILLYQVNELSKSAK
jgi:hypothetical protein